MAAPNYFRIKDGVELTAEKLSEYIQKNEALCSERYRTLQKAYNTDFDIFHLPAKPEWKPDNRIAVNFPKYIVDTMNGFFIGVPIKVTSDEDAVAEYVNFLDQYNDQDDNNAELSKIMKIYGRGYEMYYVDELGEIGITYLDPMEAFMIYDESILQRPKYFVRTYKDTDNIVHGSVSDDVRVRYFDINPSLKFRDEDEKLHGFDGVPATEYLENAERQGLFEPVMSMVNGYNKAISEKANDVDYFADAYMKILGAAMDNDDLTHIRSNRIINFEGEDGKDIIVDFLQKPNADDTQEHLIDRLERLIFQISMVANINDENFGAATGIALKYKLQSMSNLAKTEERKFTSGMNRRYKLIFSNPVSGMKKDDWTKLEYKFTRNFPANELEESEIAGNLAGITSHETQLKVLSVVDDVQAELDKIKEEQDQESNNTDYLTNRTPLTSDEQIDVSVAEQVFQKKEAVDNG
nr:MAG TPA: PORTAL PROTEIN [Caudoviricetes sp.]